MKNTIKLMASLSLVATLVACGPATPAQKPEPSKAPPAAVTPPSAPVATPTPVSATPTPVAPVATPTPVAPSSPTSSSIATPPPPKDAAFSLGTASAMKNSDFSYTVTITGNGMGVPADYKFLQVKFSSATIALIADGAPRQNVELSEVSLTATELKFRFKFESPPVGGDQIELSFEKVGAATASSTRIRLDKVTN